MSKSENKQPLESIEAEKLLKFKQITDQVIEGTKIKNWEVERSIELFRKVFPLLMFEVDNKINGRWRTLTPYMFEVNLRKNKDDELEEPLKPFISKLVSGKVSHARVFQNMGPAIDMAIELMAPTPKRNNVVVTSQDHKAVQ